MKTGMKSLLTIIFSLVIGTTAFAKNIAYYGFSVGYGGIDGQVESKFKGLTADIYYKSSTLKETWQARGFVQLDLLGYFLDFAYYQHKFAKEPFIVAPAEQVYRISRVDGGLSKLFYSQKVSLRIAFGIRAVQVGIENRVGDRVGFVETDEDKFIVPMGRIKTTLFPENRFSFTISTTGIYSNDIKSYTIESYLTADLIKKIFLQFGLSFDRLKVKTSKNDADVSILTPFISIGSYYY